MTTAAPTTDLQALDRYRERVWRAKLPTAAVVDWTTLRLVWLTVGDLTDVWTLPRVAEVIEDVTGVSYHPGHVWYILRDQLDWTWQGPARRATERNDEAIERWVKKRWPQLKKKGKAPERTADV